MENQAAGNTGMQNNTGLTEKAKPKRSANGVSAGVMTVKSAKTPWKRLAQVIQSAHRICIYPHNNADGDAIGSAVALACAVRKSGKTAFVFMGEEIPLNLRFLVTDDVCDGNADFALSADLSVLVDGGDTGRIGKRAAYFGKAGTTLCIDHHASARPTCDYNRIEEKEAATGQLIFRLIEELGIEPDERMGTALYTAIATDTGNFQYFNTQKKSHCIVAKLYDWGINPAQIALEIWQNYRQERIRVESLAVAAMRLLEGGRLALTAVTREMLRESGARMEETDNVVNILRSIGMVEAVALLKEEADGSVRVSLRSKRTIDVAEVASSLGGGGHVRAAGATLQLTLPEAEKRVEEAFRKAFLSSYRYQG